MNLDFIQNTEVAHNERKETRKEIRGLPKTHRSYDLDLPCYIRSE